MKLCFGKYFTAHCFSKTENFFHDPRVVICSLVLHLQLVWRLLLRPCPSTGGGGVDLGGLGGGVLVEDLLDVGVVVWEKK